jgi:hypothetical protein
MGPCVQNLDWKNIVENFYGIKHFDERYEMHFLMM